MTIYNSVNIDCYLNVFVIIDNMIDIIFTIENIHSDKFIYNLTRIYFCFTINQYKSYFQKLIPLAQCKYP